MGKWSRFDLGKLYLFSHVNKGKYVMIRKHLASSIHVEVLSQCNGKWRLFSLWHEIFFFLWSSKSLVYKPCCMERSFQGSVQPGLVWGQVYWYRTSRCCRKEVQGTCRRQILLPGCCSFVGSSEILRLLVPTLVAKSNTWCPILRLAFSREDNIKCILLVDLCGNWELAF